MWSASGLHGFPSQGDSVKPAADGLRVGVDRLWLFLPACRELRKSYCAVTGERLGTPRTIRVRPYECPRAILNECDGLDRQAIARSARGTPGLRLARGSKSTWHCKSWARRRPAIIDCRYLNSALHTSCCIENAIRSMFVRRSVLRWSRNSAHVLAPRQTASGSSFRAATTLVRPLDRSPPQDSTPAAAQPLRRRTRTSTQDELDEIRAAVRSDSNDTVDLAMKYISGIPSTSSASCSPVTQQRYTDLLDVFLSHPTRQSIANLLFIIARINDNSVISHDIILEAARLALAQPRFHLSLLEQILPMPKTAPGTPLIARIVPALDRHRVPPSDIANLIRARLASNPDDVQFWPGYLWQRLISYCDLDTAFQLLDQYKGIITTSKRKLPHPLSVMQVESISKPFAAVLRLWCACLTSDRRASKTPSQVAHDLVQLVGDENLPVLFLNQWLNAERIAENHSTAWSIWERFDITTNMYQHSDRPKPDKQTWTVFFKLQKTAEHQCSRQTWKALFNTVHPLDITTHLLNSALSELMTDGRAGVCHDLPALLFLMSKFDCAAEPQCGPPPDARTIDIVAAGLIRIWREQGAFLDRLFVSDSARYVRGATLKWRETVPRAYATHVLEWRLVDRAIRELLPVPASQRNQPHGSRAKLPELLPMAGRSRSDGTKVPKVDCITPSEMHLPMMQLVERTIRLLLAERAGTDKQLDKAYKAMWSKVQDDILGSDAEALSHAFEGPIIEGEGRDMATTLRVMQRIFGENNRAPSASDAQRAGNRDQFAVGDD